MRGNDFTGHSPGRHKRLAYCRMSIGLAAGIASSPQDRSCVAVDCDVVNLHCSCAGESNQEIILNLVDFFFFL